MSLAMGIFSWNLGWINAPGALSVSFLVHPLARSPSGLQRSFKTHLHVLENTSCPLKTTNPWAYPVIRSLPLHY